MLGLILIVVLGTTVLVGTTIGGRYHVAPPVLLIVLGGLLGLVPALSAVELEPNVVLLLFLPAILYRESIATSLREIRANLRVIALSGIALVVVTAVTVSYAAQALGVAPAAAWVLGAVLAPTDAAAVAGLAKRMPRRTLTTLQAESLINDGTALVLFAVAVAAAVSGNQPGPLELVGDVVGSYAGGIVAGLLVSGLVSLVRRRLDDPMREGALSVLTPFTAFLLAEVVHASGVVAVVVAGLVMSWVSPRLIRARSRLATLAFWDQSTFLLNGALFTLVGIQIPRAARSLNSASLAHALWVALLVTLVVVGTRLLWTFLAAYVLRAIDRRPSQHARRVGWRQRLASGWAGFRGAVSLAAALAVPVVLDSGAPFPDRDLIVFTTSVVVLVTILVQGISLPFVLRWAGLERDAGRDAELLLARTRAAEAALAALPRVAGDLGVDGDLLARVQAEYEEHAESIQYAEGTDADPAAADARELLRRLRLGVLDHKRSAVTGLRNAGEIDDFVLREIQAVMDIEELRLLGPAPAD